jgi:hypothetical protein
MLDHVEERFEDSRREWYSRAVLPSQEPFHRVEPEIAEFVEVSSGSLHRRFQKNSEKFNGNLKTFIMRRANLTTRESAQASRVDKEQ